MARKYAELSVSSIIVDRPQRQRRTVGSVQDLADSIKRIGVLNPITITRENCLIAGERRLEACRLLGGDFKIPVRYLDELDPLELQLIELDENLRRSELSWADQVRAVASMHQILKQKNPDGWTQEDTAKYLGHSFAYISKSLAVASHLSDDKVKKAENLSKAISHIERESKRAVANELNTLFEVLDEPKEEGQPKSQAKILNEDFSQWVKTPQRKFNLIHCDFPYGIDFQNSEQGFSAGKFETYEDSEDTYWKLVSLLCEYTDQLAYPSAHLVFWFSMKFYQKTIDYIQENSNWELVTEHPLIWLKSDNKGIVSDVTRRPRNVYETALLFSRGDRKIISPVANGYAAPTSKTFHASEKPEPMLKHFFRLFVDEHTEILDPTCGSGSAIRAAFELGAKRSLGLELNPEFAKEADQLLTRKKGMKQLEKEIE